jgi:hypothetical protein
MIGLVTLSPADRRTLVVLHEIGHATGAEAADHMKPNGESDWSKSQEYDRKIAAACFGS